jgi:acetyltransferase
MSSNAHSQDEPEKGCGYPTDWVEKAILLDGTQVTIRPIQPSDAEPLREGFKHLSPQSIYLRFLTPLNELSESQARSFANVDYHSSMAFVATPDIDSEAHIIGVARYGMVGLPDPEAAECAIVVGDEYQRKGLGLRLLDQLVRYARQQRVNYFLATVHSTNDRTMSFIKRSGFPFERKMDVSGIWEIRINIIYPNFAKTNGDLLTSK